MQEWQFGFVEFGWMFNFTYCNKRKTSQIHSTTLHCTIQQKQNREWRGVEVFYNVSLTLSGVLEVSAVSCWWPGPHPGGQLTRWQKAEISTSSSLESVNPPPPTLPEKCLNSSRKVPQKFWNEVTHPLPKKFPKTSRKVPQKVWN